MPTLTAELRDMVRELVQNSSLKEISAEIDISPETLTKALALESISRRSLEAITNHLIELSGKKDPVPSGVLPGLKVENGGAGSKDDPPPPHGDGKDSPAISQVAGAPKPDLLPAEDPTLNEVYIPVEGFVWLTDEEIRVVNHPSFQRLRRVKQLGLASLVYPGATHTRFEHVLGVLGMADRIIKSVETNTTRFVQKRSLRSSEKSEEALEHDGSTFIIGSCLNNVEKRFTRLAALLHDIGHLPFGHSIEDELHILNKHDKEHRLRLVLNFVSWDPDQALTLSPKVSSTSWIFQEASLGDLIDKRFAPPGSPMTLASISSSISPSQLLVSIILHKPVKCLWDVYENKVGEARIMQAFREDLFKLYLRFHICADIVGNTICADLIDYLQRDWHHVGKSKYLEDRLLQYMEIACPARYRRDNKSSRMIDTAILDRRTPDDRFVINLRTYPRLRTDAVSVILEMLENRYNLAEAVLFHRTKLSATAVLERCLFLAASNSQEKVDKVDEPSSKVFKDWEQTSDGNEEWDVDLERRLLQTSDDGFLEGMLTGNTLFNIPGNHADLVKSLVRRVRNRDHFDHVITIAYQEGQTGPIDSMQELYSDHDKAATNREIALRQLESDFGLNLGDCAMYCPERRMNSKIAEVQVLIQGRVYKLEEYEKKSDGDLAGGHLTAQLRRFKRLWRISLFLNRDVQHRFGLHDRDWRLFEGLLGDYFRLFSLGVSAPGRSLIQEKEVLIERLASNEGVLMKLVASQGIFKPVRNAKLVRELGEEVAAARGRRGAVDTFAKRLKGHGEFPNGQKSFWTLFG